MAPGPRIVPGSSRELGFVNASFATLAGLVTRTGRPNIFTTLGRHRRLFRAWLRFAGRLMPRGTLPRRETELVILRVARNTGCEYERAHHVRLARRAGVSADDIAHVLTDDTQELDAWAPREAALLAAVDELHERRVLGDERWDALRAVGLSDTDLIEFLLLVGHYEMLAMTLNTLRVQPD